MKGITKEIKEEEESWCNNANGLWKEKTTAKTQSHHTAVSRLWKLPFPCQLPRTWTAKTHKMKARPCSKPNIQLCHNDLVLNSGFMSYLLKYWWHLLFSQEKLYFGIPQPRRGCMPASHHPQHVATSTKTLLSAAALQSEVYLTGSSQSALTCAIIDIFHFHNLSI